MKALTISSNQKARVLPLPSLIISILLLGAVVGFALWRNSLDGKVLTHHLSEPLGGATTAKVDINTDSGNLTIDRLSTGEQLLASGTLEYLEDQELTSQSVNTTNAQATLTLRTGSTRKPWFRFPWTACSGATEWQVHLNPNVQSDITAHSGGGNVSLNLASMAITNVSADTGGGNIAVVLPDNAANLNMIASTGMGNVTVEIGSPVTGSNIINAKSGAGDVAIQVPSGIAARIHVTNGLGKPIIDSRFSKIDSSTYQSPDYDGAANKVEITVNSGAGNVSVNTK
jgi:hypothetical protein